MGGGGLCAEIMGRVFGSVGQVVQIADCSFWGDKWEGRVRVSPRTGGQKMGGGGLCGVSVEEFSSGSVT